MGNFQQALFSRPMAVRSLQPRVSIKTYTLDNPSRYALQRKIPPSETSPQLPDCSDREVRPEPKIQYNLHITKKRLNFVQI